MKSQVYVSLNQLRRFCKRKVHNTEFRHNKTNYVGFISLRDILWENLRSVVFGEKYQPFGTKGNMSG